MAVGNNKTVGEPDVSEEGKEYPVIELYLALPLRLFAFLVIIFFTTVVLFTVKKSRNKKQTFHYFFVSNLMFSDMAVALISNFSTMVLILHSIINHSSEGIRCTSIRAGSFPHIASVGMLAALTFDRMIVAVYPTRYRQIVTKCRAYVMVIVIWLGSLLVAFLAYVDQNLHVKTRTAMCSADYYNYIMFGIILIPTVASIVFVVVQNVYNFSLALEHVRSLRECGTTGNEQREIDHMAEYREAFSLYWDTQRPSIAALLLVGVDVLLHVIILPILVIIAKQFPDSTLSAVIWSIFNNLVIYSATACHSFLYSWFLDSFSVLFGWRRCRIRMLSCAVFISGTPNQLNGLNEH